MDAPPPNNLEGRQFLCRHPVGIENLAAGLGGPPRLAELSQDITYEVAGPGLSGDPRGLRIRWLIKSIELVTAATHRMIMRYQYNAGSWTNVNTTATHLQSLPSDYLIQGDDCGDLSTMGGGQPFFANNNGQVDIGGISDATSWPAGVKEAEIEWSLLPIHSALNIGDTLHLKPWKKVVGSEDVFSEGHNGNTLLITIAKTPAKFSPSGGTFMGSAAGARATAGPMAGSAVSIGPVANGRTSMGDAADGIAFMGPAASGRAVIKPKKGN